MLVPSLFTALEIDTKIYAINSSANREGNDINFRHKKISKINKIPLQRKPEGEAS